MRIISTHPKRQLKDEDGNLREPYEPFKSSHGWAATKMPSNTYLITVDDLKRQVLKGDRARAQTIAQRMNLSASGNTNDIKARIVKALYQGKLSEKDELEARIAELEAELEKVRSGEPTLDAGGHLAPTDGWEILVTDEDGEEHIFQSIDTILSWFDEVELDAEEIQQCLYGEQESHKGLTFEYREAEEPATDDEAGGEESGDETEDPEESVEFNDHGLNLDDLDSHSLKELKPLADDLGVSYDGKKEDYVAALQLALEARDEG